MRFLRQIIWTAYQKLRVLNKKLMNKFANHSTFIKVVLTIACYFITIPFFAQEQLIPLNSNINLPLLNTKKTILNKTSSVPSLDTIPFFDDFYYAYSSPYPTKNHWIDSNVYVNTGFANAPISIGIATFDGLNKKGYPYNISAPLSNSAQADYLTSRPINLQKKGAFTYNISDSLYLSFYYQAEGKGDAPESTDSLVLDFYKPNQNKWQKVWGIKGYNPSSIDTNFYLVMIAIKDTAYLDSLFQFRFRNKATLSGSLDHWNVDYIYLNKDRTIGDTIFEDDAFVYKSTPFLKNYSSMPYRQFAPLEMATGIKNYLRNNFTSEKNTTYGFKVFEKSNLITPTYTYSGGNANIQPFRTSGYHSVSAHASPFFSYIFPSPLTDSTYFKIVHTISSSPDLVRPNDTLVQIQRFSNYYAYDDGSAEVGYYLNTYGAKTAVRFTLNVFDTLRAMNIYFDPIVDGNIITGSSFRMVVWADGGSGPSNTVIYKDSLRYPSYLQGSYNLIPTYTLTSCLRLEPGTYYMGIQQTTNKGLNIGFDKNTNHSDALYYDIGGGWVQSAIPGSIMINPIMGCTVPEIVNISEHERSLLLSLFPNPAQNEVNLKSSMPELEFCTISVYSSIGQEVINTPFENNKTINISELPNGIYFVKLNDSRTTLSTKKLIISR